MNWLSLRNDRLKFKTSGGLPITLEESIEENASNQYRKTEGCQHIIQPVGLAKTRISTDHAQKPPRSLSPTRGKSRSSWIWIVVTINLQVKHLSSSVVSFLKGEGAWLGEEVGWERENLGPFHEALNPSCYRSIMEMSKEFWPVVCKPFVLF